MLLNSSFFDYYTDVQLSLKNAIKQVFLDHKELHLQGEVHFGLRCVSLIPNINNGTVEAGNYSVHAFSESAFNSNAVHGLILQQVTHIVYQFFYDWSVDNLQIWETVMQKCTADIMSLPDSGSIPVYTNNDGVTKVGTVNWIRRGDIVNFHGFNIATNTAAGTKHYATLPFKVYWSDVAGMCGMTNSAEVHLNPVIDTGCYQICIAKINTSAVYFNFTTIISSL